MNGEALWSLIDNYAVWVIGAVVFYVGVTLLIDMFLRK